MKISVIVPVYNIESYVEACVESLISQTFGDIEIILVDDGSTDGSGEICDKAAKNHSEIKVVHKPNGGLSSARNAGLDVARGEYVMFVDGDDRLVPDACEILLDTVKDADMVQFGYVEVFGTEPPPYSPIGSVASETVTDEKEKYDRLYALGGEGASACTKFYRRKLFENLRFRVGVRHEDEDIVTDVLSLTDKVVYIKAPLYLYFFRSGSIINGSFGTEKLEYFDVLNRRVKVLTEKGYEDLVSETYRRVFLMIPTFYYETKKAGMKEENERVVRELKAIPDRFGKKFGGVLGIRFRLMKNSRLFRNIVYLYKKLRKT